MQWIPVIDLRAGQVVHARRGERERYAPVRSSLVEGSEPATVLQALLAALPAASAPVTVYVADLDAIGGAPVQAAVLAGLLSRWPGLQWWIDAGFGSAAAALEALGPLTTVLAPGAALRPVFGTESFTDAAALAAAVRPEACAPLGAPLLSLDRRGQPLGAAAAWDDASAWPREVIVMTLEAVGAEAGPALDAVRRVRERAGAARRVIGAGGVRDAADLAAAAAAGADAWLLATALHKGTLHPQGPRADLGTRTAGPGPGA